MTKKYELTNNKKELFGVILTQIRALVDIQGVVSKLDVYWGIRRVGRIRG